MLQKFRENWVRPALFFGNNPISLAGGAITSAAGVTMIGYWLVETVWPAQRQSLSRNHLLSDFAWTVCAGARAHPGRRVCPAQKAAE